MIAAAGATLTGIYATVVFSSMMLNGKAALGMEQDEKYNSFMENTGQQRVRGFYAFTISLTLFSILALLEVCLEFYLLCFVNRSPPFLSSLCTLEEKNTIK
ncbi:MAG: hypothetical protein ACI8RD_009507 [Bacillariaceae sp.]